MKLIVLVSLLISLLFIGCSTAEEVPQRCGAPKVLDKMAEQCKYDARQCKQIVVGTECDFYRW